MTHDDALDLLPLYALDALDARERAALEAHMRDCVSCRRQLAEEQRALDVLARAPEQVRPRPELRARVIAAAMSGGAAPPPVSVETPGDAGRRPPTLHDVRSNTRWHWLALAAATLLALYSSLGLLSARREVGMLRDEVASWQERVAQAEARAAAAAGELNSQRRAVAVLTSTDLVQTTLQGVPPTGGAVGRAFLSLSTGTVLMSAQGLPVPPPGRTYQLWAIVGSQPVSAGTFTADASGRAQLLGQMPALAAAPAALAVTLEPEGGVPSPTGPKVLLGTPAN